MGAVRARRAGRARLGGADRRRAAGQGAGAVGVQDRQDRRARVGGAVVAGSGAGDLAADPRAAPREISRWRLHLVMHRSILKNRVHSTLIAFGHQVPMADLFGLGGRRLLAGLDIPQPWRGHVDASVELIDDLELRISLIEAELKRSGADHRYVPLLLTAPGFGWITSFTVACEIGDIGRFSSPVKLAGYTGLCPRVKQSGDMDQRGRLSKHGPRYLRWGLLEAAIHAASHPLYKERYQRTKRRLGRQRGAKVAQIDLARKLTEAIWHMLTRNQPFKPFAPAGAISRLTA